MQPGVFEQMIDFMFVMKMINNNNKVIRLLDEQSEPVSRKTNTFNGCNSHLQMCLHALDHVEV